MRPKITAEGLHVGAQDPTPGIFGTGLRRPSRGLGIPFDDLWHPVLAGKPVDGIDLVAQALPAVQRFPVGLAVAVANAAERVRAVPDGGAGLREEPSEATIERVRRAACSVHRVAS